MAITYNLYRKSYPKDKRVFADTNIFIFVFWQLRGQNLRAPFYITDYTELQNRGFKIYTNFDVIAEAINLVMHYEWNNTKGFNPTIYDEFKLFRDSPQGQKLLNVTYDDVERHILNHVEILDRTFSLQDIREMIVNDGLDCTDKMINKICTEYNVPLFTDDKDFRHTKLDILTRNKMIINEKSRAVEVLRKNDN